MGWVRLAVKLTDRRGLSATSVFYTHRFGSRARSELLVLSCLVPWIAMPKKMIDVKGKAVLPAD